MALSSILEALIDASITDGVISEQERKVLHKKAAQEGVTPDELDIIINARLQKAMGTVPEDGKARTNRCPLCGEYLPPMSSVCPACGNIIDGTTPESRDLKRLLDEMEFFLVKLRNPTERMLAKAKLEGLIRQANQRYGENARVKTMIQQIESAMKKYEATNAAEEQKAKDNNFKIGWIIAVGLAILMMMMMN